METTYNYTYNGNRLTSSTDPLDNTTLYSFEPNFGTLTNTTDPLGSMTSYAYDNMQRLTGVCKAVLGLHGDETQMQKSYTYERFLGLIITLLEKITRLYKFGIFIATVVIGVVSFFEFMIPRSVE